MNQISKDIVYDNSTFIFQFGVYICLYMNKKYGKGCLQNIL